MKTCVVKMPGAPAEVRQIKGTLDELQGLVGGYIELVPVHGVSIYCNDDCADLTANVELELVGVVSGPVVVLGEVDADGNETGLSDEQAETWRVVLGDASVR